MRQALVLGGGGIIGVAWESGLLAGLAEAGIDATSFEIVVGTSAGAIMGARLLGGLALVAGAEKSAPASGRASDAAAESGGIDLGKLDLGAMGRIFPLWAAMERATPAKAAEIGALARDLYREREDGWVRTIGAAVGSDAWPERPLLVSAVDTESGERRFFDRASGLPLGRVVASSSAVPGLSPSVTIEGRRYMDGQVWSSTHADVLLGRGFDRVVVAMPTNAFTAQAIGAHADRALDAERAALRAESVEVALRTPTAEDAARIGTNLMDPTKAPVAHEIGLATGRAWSRELRA
jgi:NTE family protein